MAENPASHNKLKKALNSIDAIIAPSTELLQIAKKFLGTHKTAKYIPNAVDLNRFNLQIAKGSIRNKLGINKQAPVLLCPRRLVQKNGIDFLIMCLPAILANFSSAKVIIVGDGPERRKLEELAKSLGITESVLFIGSIPNVEMPAFYADADIVILPSLKEATSIAGLEAMACGKPLVATNVGGIPEILDHNQSGVLVPSQNSQAIADAVIDLLSTPERCYEIGVNANHHVMKNFNWNVTALETIEVYRLASDHKFKAF